MSIQDVNITSKLTFTIEFEQLRALLQQLPDEQKVELTCLLISMLQAKNINPAKPLSDFNKLVLSRWLMADVNNMPFDAEMWDKLPDLDINYIDLDDPTIPEEDGIEMTEDEFIEAVRKFDKGEL